MVTYIKNISGNIKNNIVVVLKTNIILMGFIAVWSAWIESLDMFLVVFAIFKKMAFWYSSSIIMIRS